MNRYLVNKEDTKHLRRIFVLKKVQWNEEADEKGNLWFVSEIDAERFDTLLKTARVYKKEEETGFLSTKFHPSPKKPGVVYCRHAMMDHESISRVDAETVERYIELREQESGRKFTKEEKESFWEK